MNFGVPITLFPLDVTQKVEMRASMFDEVRNVARKKVDFIRRMSATYRAFHCSSRGGVDGCYVHDALTVAWLLDPTLAQLERGRVTVDLAGDDVGRTHWTPDPAGNVDTAIHFDSERFFRLFWGALGRKNESSLLD
jgi:inosine-uridine nucleoside N-ribohydrolase